MKKMIDAVKNGVANLFSNENVVLAFVLALIVIVAWLLGWLMGHATGGIVQVFEQAAFGMHGVASAAVVAGAAGVGRHFEGEPLTTAGATAQSPELLRNEIDRRIVKIRPMSTPLDQISRFGGSRPCGSMKVEYYSVDTRPSSARITAAVEACSEREPGVYSAVLPTSENALFQPTTTVIVPSVKASNGDALMLYVQALTDEGVKVLPVNNEVEPGVKGVPAMPQGTELVRMGRAAAELDVMSPTYGVVPTKSDNLCQIFKTQVEQTTFMKIANKEVGWTFSDQEEAAIIDMRLGMERNFLFGQKARIVDPDKGEEICLTGGVWNQTDNEFRYKASEGFDEEKLVKMLRQAFSHSAGSSKKVLLAGSGLIEKLHLLKSQRVMLNDAVTTRWGLDFTELHSKFGTLYVLLAEVFDQCGLTDSGMVIDPEYITKYSHVPFRTDTLNLRKSGLRNVDAIVITEASCLVLRYPQSHMKIVAQ